MKKLLFSLVATIVGAMGMYAQNSYVATLDHEGTITCYYGSSAISYAVNASVDGDVITVSAGIFNSFSISGKAITIRGAGILKGNDNAYTSIMSGTTCSIGSNVTIEGIRFANVWYNSGTNGTTFNKCTFQTLKQGSAQSAMENCTFVNCIINIIQMNNYCKDNIFRNCYIAGYITGSTPYFYNATLINSFIRYNNSINNCNFTNCIISTNQIGASNSLAYCICINNSTFTEYQYYGSCDKTNCVYGTTDFYGLFKSWNDAIDTDNVNASSFELTDDAKATYLGIDGTQVGMLGGDYPYSPVVSIPRITTCEVAEKATADGKLNVNIAVTAPTE